MGGTPGIRVASREELIDGGEMIRARLGIGVEITGEHNQFLEGDRARYLEGLNKFLTRVEAAREQQPSEVKTEDRH